VSTGTNLIWGWLTACKFRSKRGARRDRFISELVASFTPNAVGPRPLAGGPRVHRRPSGAADVERVVTFGRL